MLSVTGSVTLRPQHRHGETLIPHSVREHGLVPVCTEQEGTVCLAGTPAAHGYTLAFFWCCQQTPSRTESRRKKTAGATWFNLGLVKQH